MKNGFNLDNPFFSMMGRLADYVILNLLFLLTALPVVTIGPALCAMHELVIRMSEGTEGSLVRTYLRAFGRNFGCALRTWLPLLFAGIILILDVTVAADAFGADFQKILLPVAGSLIIFWLLIFSRVFWLTIDPEIKVSVRFTAALSEAVRSLPKTFLMIGIEILPFVGYLFFIRVFLGILLPLYVCVGFSFSGWLCGLLSGRISIGKYKDGSGGAQ